MLRMRMLAPAITAAALTVVAVSGGTALAAPTASYTHWAAAQRAAGFLLLRPGSTLRLQPASPIIVYSCHREHERQVFALWGRKSTQVELVQTNSRNLCGIDLAGLRRLAAYPVDGTTARLYGYCGRYGQPPCTSRHSGLFLIWTTHRVTHLAFSVNEWRSSLVRFARSLHPAS